MQPEKRPVKPTLPDQAVTPRPRRDDRRAAIILAARELFFAHGYGRTAMSAVAARIGGSKTTLWTHFPSKEALFAAVVDDIARSYEAALDLELPDAQPAEAVLHRFGCAVLETVQLDPIVELQRLVTGEAGRFPELARIYWQAGPARFKSKLTTFVERRMQIGELRRGEAVVAARQFAGMLQIGPHQMHVLGLVPKLSAGDRSAIVDAAVDSFSRSWRAL